jgi:hypothetical protein
MTYLTLKESVTGQIPKHKLMWNATVDIISVQTGGLPLVGNAPLDKLLYPKGSGPDLNLDFVIWTSYEVSVYPLL